MNSVAVELNLYNSIHLLQTQKTNFLTNSNKLYTIYTYCETKYGFSRCLFDVVLCVEPIF